MYQLKIKTLDRKGWRDKDTVMFHACFQLLTDYIELEKPDEVFDLKHSQNKDTWKEIFYLYRWWTVERPKRKKFDIAEPLTKEECELYKLDDFFDIYTLNYEFKDLPPFIARKIKNFQAKCDKWCAQQDKYDIEDQEHLERLIKVRSHLWT